MMISPVIIVFVMTGHCFS